MQLRCIQLNIFVSNAVDNFFWGMLLVIFLLCSVLCTKKAVWFCPLKLMFQMCRFWSFCDLSIIFYFLRKIVFFFISCVWMVIYLASAFLPSRARAAWTFEVSTLKIRAKLILIFDWCNSFLPLLFFCQLPPALPLLMWKICLLSLPCLFRWVDMIN